SDGDVRYSINIMVDGQRVHRVIGRESDGTTRTQAENFITKTRADARDGRLQLPKGRKTALTFAKAAKLYLEGEKEVGAKDMVSKEGHLRLHLVPYFGSMRVERISKFTVEKFRNDMLRHGYKLGNVNRVLSTYRHMGYRLADQGKIQSPLPMIKLKEPDNRRSRVLTHDEEGLLLAAASRDSNPYIWLFVKVGLSTSLRHAEILSARFDGLDARRRRLRVRVKGGRDREQPLSSELTQILEREREMAEDPDGWIFPSPKSASGHIEDMKTAFKRCVIRAGLSPKEVIPHTMRHTAITNLAETGADIPTIQEFSGHLSLKMVMRYTHARDRRVNHAVDEMERAKTKVERIAPPKKQDS
ncbi:MAG: site-specific integrase, partial [Proteobacteria bacterium]|nr:site-specific integrase [Pseudomonadota bacterium]